MSLFAYDGPVMEEMRKFSNLVMLNLLFCLFSLPLVTLGASLAALYACAQAMLAGGEEPVIARQFLAEFRRNLKKATFLWLLCLLFAAAWALAFTWLAALGAAGGLGRLLLLALAALFLLGGQYIFPLQARYENAVGRTLKNAWLLAAAALPWTLAALGVTLGAVWVSFFMNPAAAGLGVFAWAAAGFGLLAYVNSIFFRQAFRLLERERI